MPLAAPRTAAAHAADHEEPLAWALVALVALSGGRVLFDAFRGSQLAEAGASGGFLVLTLPAAAAWALGSSGRRRGFGLAAAALGAVGLVATRSVPALVALAFALGLVGMRRARFATRAGRGRDGARDHRLLSGPREAGRRVRDAARR